MMLLSMMVVVVVEWIVVMSGMGVMLLGMWYKWLVGIVIYLVVVFIWFL